jgi:hypothetical protein
MSSVADSSGTQTGVVRGAGGRGRGAGGGRGGNRVGRGRNNSQRGGGGGGNRGASGRGGGGGGNRGRGGGCGRSNSSNNGRGGGRGGGGHQQNKRGSGTTKVVAKKKPEYEFQFLDDALSTPTTTTSHSKNNLNHLLNFNRGAIVSTAASDAAFRQQQQQVRRRRQAQPVFRKERFMQATCRFVVEDVGVDTLRSLSDANHEVNWDSVQLVHMPIAATKADTKDDDDDDDGAASGGQRCPVCLSPPVAAQVTRCGHVFCYACILHALSTSSKNWVRCPLCFESVYPKALKSVRVHALPPPVVGDSITFKLLCRRRGTILSAPYHTSSSPSSASSSSHKDDNPFSRVTLTSDIDSIGKLNCACLASLNHSLPCLCYQTLTLHSFVRSLPCIPPS